MLENGHDFPPLEDATAESAIAVAVSEATDLPKTDVAVVPAPANSESMVVDECIPAASDSFDAGVLRTPTKGNGAKAVSNLSEEIFGATPGRHTSSEFKCVYPPSEDAQSLIVEHFGFLPISFIDEIINAANDTIYRATDALSKFVETEQGSSEATSQAVNKAETLLEHAVDKNFDKFELYALRNLFNIPRGLEDYVVMPHRRADICSSPQVFAEDEAELDKELDEVRRQLVANNLLKTKLQCDMAKVERGVRRLRALNEQLHISEIAQKTLTDPVPVVAADMRAQIDEITRLANQLELVTESGSLASLDALSDPAARDIYLARIADIQVSGWESRQAQLRTK
ncbi:hypothetical protein GGI19_004374 [Coemansia pectinata]|uniref:Uncharacterized protein n=1 Tax=Coemansia pectinata TaxID=1052879 RepID=A0A9W8LAM0_9FUNG|nr:hypothetical protein GGI19_004374 [Coemansia pectinata]